MASFVEDVAGVEGAGEGVVDAEVFDFREGANCGFV
jgi:hypothetical protein